MSDELMPIEEALAKIKGENQERFGKEMRKPLYDAILQTYSGADSAATRAENAANAANQATDSAQEATSAALAVANNIAKPFDDTKDYSAGEYVLYNSNIYKFTSNHSAGAWSDLEVTQVEISSEISGLKYLLSESTVNVATIIDSKDITIKGITFTSSSNTCKVRFSGVTTETGDTFKFINSALEEADNYRVVIYGEVNRTCKFVCRKNGAFETMPTLDVDEKSVVSNIIALTQSDILSVTLQANYGDLYDCEIQVMVCKDGEIPNEFVPPKTAKDLAARNGIQKLNSTIQDYRLTLATFKNKLDSTWYYGIGKKLTNNFNYGENTTTPRLLYPQDNTDHYPGVRVVEDTDSPVARLFGYKHEIYKGEQTGWQSVINSFPIHNEDVVSYSIGFWVNIQELSAVFQNDNYLGLLLYRNNNIRYELRVYPTVLISNVNTAYTVEIINNGGILESADASAICRDVNNGYAYIEIDLKNIVYVTDINWNAVATLLLYIKFDSVVNSLANKQITIVGFTVLQNAVIESPYYRHPDEQGLVQIPNEKSIDERFEVDEDKSDNQVRLIYNPNEYEDVIVQSKNGGALVENYMVATYDHEEYNSTCHPTACFVTIDGVRKCVLLSEDDGCPINLTSGYLAAGHGYAKGAAVTALAHGKTFVDIGSKWMDGDGKTFYLIKIIDENTIGLIEDTISTSTEYDMARAIPTGQLTHVSDATHTDGLSDYAVDLWQIEPIVKSEGHTKKVLMNGTNEVMMRGTYYGQFVDVTEEYDVANPRGIIDSVLSNKPTGGYTKNPDFNKGPSFMHFSNLYRFLSDGTLLLFSTIDSDVQLSLGYWGGTQYAEKNHANVYGGTCKKYLPGTLPVTVNGATYDMRIPKDMLNWNANLSYRSEYWEDADYPPDRCVTFYTDNNGDIKAGYAVGYLPVALGDPATRKTNVYNALNLYTSKKYYPHLIDNQNIQAYTPLQSIVYRKPVTDVASKHTDAYFVPCGDVCYLYADYHAIADDRIKIPTQYIGKSINVIKKTDNVNIYGTIATDEIRIRVATADPMYGYAVVKIG